MRGCVAILGFVVATSVARPVHANAEPSATQELLEGLSLLLLPSGVGFGLTGGGDKLDPALLLSWPLQIPLGESSLRRFTPRFRVVLEPIASFAVSGMEFQLRVAPRFVIPFAPSVYRGGNGWTRTALFISAGTTARFASFDPSLHAELGVIYDPEGPEDDGFKWWISLRNDTWFGGSSTEHRLALMAGWSLY